MPNLKFSRHQFLTYISSDKILHTFLDASHQRLPVNEVGYMLNMYDMLNDVLNATDQTLNHRTDQELGEALFNLRTVIATALQRRYQMALFFGVKHSHGLLRVARQPETENVESTKTIV